MPDKNSARGSGPRLSFLSLLIFGSPGVAATLLVTPIYGVLPSYYALNTKVTLAQVAAVFLVARVLDALTDPLVGILSDRTRTPIGARLPWMICGAALAMPSVYYLFVPPPSADMTYFFIWSFLAMTAWTLLTIPHNAWAAELAVDYDERSRIFGVKNVLASLGGFMFFLLPVMLFPITHTTEFEHETMMGLVVLLWILLPLTLLWATLKAPLKPPGDIRATVKEASLMDVLRSVARNKPFLQFVMITSFGGIANGMTTALIFLYVQDYMKLGDYFYLVGIVGAVCSILSVPLWIRLSKKFNKHSVWAIGLILESLIGLSLVFLQPGPAALVPLFIILIAGGIMRGVSLPLPASVLADVADYEAWKQNTNATGNYFSLLVLLSKTTAALGGALALFVSGAMGYVPNSEDAQNISALMVPMVFIPLFFSLVAAFLLWRFPLNRGRQAIIAKRLAQRADRELAKTTA
nr:MFS transporter [uncultured Hyphomonas sp.]